MNAPDEMIAAAASLARGFQFTDEGLEWAIANQRDVVSLSYFYDTLLTNPGQMDSHADAVRRALRHAKGNASLAATLEEVVHRGDRMPPSRIKRLMRRRVEQFLARESGAKRDPFKTERGVALLRLAIVNGALSALTTMLRRVDATSLLTPDAFRGQSALTLAAGAGQDQCVERLLPLGDPMAPDGKGQTALMTAAAAGSAECLRLLLPASDPNAVDENGQTALILAAGEGHADCVSLLMAHCDLNAKDNDGRTALMAAACNARLACVNRLLEHSDPALSNRSGQTALTLAVTGGHRDCVKALLAHPASVAACPNGETALMIAAALGDADCVRLLMPACDPRAVSRGATALMRAAESGHAECVQLLLPVRDALAQDWPRERSALMLAAAGAHTECVELLAEHADARSRRRALCRFGREAAPRLAALCEADQLQAVMHKAAPKNELQAPASLGPNTVAESVQSQPPTMRATRRI